MSLIWRQRFYHQHNDFLFFAPDARWQSPSPAGTKLAFTFLSFSCRFCYNNGNKEFFCQSRLRTWDRLKKRFIIIMHLEKWIFFRLCVHMDNLNKEHGAKFSFYSGRTSRVYSFLSRQFALNLLPSLQKLPWGERASGTSPLWKKYVLKGWTDTVYFKTPARLGPLGGLMVRKRER